MVILAGCGGSADRMDAGEVAGTYRIDSHVGSRCAVDQPVQSDAAYLALRLFAEGAVIQACPDTPTNQCGPSTSLPEMIAHGWSGSDASAESHENGRICILQYREYAVTVIGGHLSFDSTTYGSTFGVVTCTADEARMRGTAMPCALHERIEATAAPAPFP